MNFHLFLLPPVLVVFLRYGLLLVKLLLGNLLEPLVLGLFDEARYLSLLGVSVLRADCEVILRHPTELVFEEGRCPVFQKLNNYLGVSNLASKHEWSDATESLCVHTQEAVIVSVLLY